MNFKWLKRETPPPTCDLNYEINRLLGNVPQGTPVRSLHSYKASLDKLAQQPWLVKIGYHRTDQTPIVVHSTTIYDHEFAAIKRGHDVAKDMGMVVVDFSQTSYV